MNTVDIKKLKQRATELLQANGYTEKSIGNFSYTWNALIRYMSERGISEYTSSVGSSFLEFHFKEKLSAALSKSDKAYVHRVKVLDYLLEEDSLLFRTKDCPYVFEGDIAEPFLLFLQYIEQTYSPSTLRNYRRYLYEFYTFLCESKFELKLLSPQSALWFIGYIEKKAFVTDKVKHIIESVRVFVIWLAGQGFLKENFSR